MMLSAKVAKNTVIHSIVQLTASPHSPAGNSSKGRCHGTKSPDYGYGASVPRKIIETINPNNNEICYYLCD